MFYLNTSFRYVRCFFFAAKTAMSVGRNPKPTAVPEYVFMAISWLLGVFVFAILLAQVRPSEFEEYTRIRECDVCWWELWREACLVGGICEWAARSARLLAFWRKEMSSPVVTEDQSRTMDTYFVLKTPWYPFRDSGCNSLLWIISEFIEPYCEDFLSS